MRRFPTIAHGLKRPNHFPATFNRCAAIAAWRRLGKAKHGHDRVAGQVMDLPARARDGFTDDAVEFVKKAGNRTRRQIFAECGVAAQVHE